MSAPRPNQAPTLSVVVPVVDKAPQLFEALWAICRQESMSEVIVVDAAGVAGAAVAAVDDARVRVIPLEPVTKAAGFAARNAGLAQATGSYVAVADPDGLVAAGGYDRAVASLEASGSDVVAAPAEQFGRERKRHWTTRTDAFAAPGSGVRLAERPSLILDRTLWTKVFRRSFLVEAGLLAAALPDLVLAARSYLAARSVDVLTETGSFRRNSHRGDADARWPTRPAAWIDGIAESLRLLDEASEPDAAAALASHAAATELPLWMDELAGAPKLAGRAASVATRVVAATPVTRLVQLPLRTRWQLALVSAGHAELLGSVETGDLPSPAELESLDHLPEPLLAALGLNGRPAAEVFADRFAPRQQRVWPSGPVPDPVREPAPEISVIIPTYNVADYVDELLRSVRAARGVGLEIIVVDDASSDGTWEIVQQHAAADPRLVCVRSSGKGGGQARNQGVGVATGEFLAFADGDDIVPPTAYAAMLAAARSTDAEVVSGGYQKFLTRDGWDPSTAYDYRVGIDAVALGGQPAMVAHRACWNRLIRRDFWLAHALEFPSVPRSNDIAPITSVLTAARRLTVVPDVVYLYRERPGSGSMTAKRGSRASISSYLEQEARCAALVGRLGDPGVDAVYWWTFLARDGYVHLREYLATQAEAADDAHHEVGRRYAALLDLAPADQVARLLPVQRALYALVALGRVELAAALAASSDNPEALTPAEAMAVLEAVAGSRLVDAETLSRLVWRLVVRGAARQAGSGAAGLLTAIRTFTARYRAMPVVVPGSTDERVVAVLERGTADDLVALFEPAGERPALRLGLRSVRISGSLPSGVRGPVRLVASRETRGTAARVFLGPVQAGDGAWHATVTASRLSHPGEWKLALEFQDEWGLRRLALKPRVAPLPSVVNRLARFAPVRGEATIGLRPGIVRRIVRSLRGTG